MINSTFLYLATIVISGSILAFTAIAICILLERVDRDSIFGKIVFMAVSQFAAITILFMVLSFIANYIR